MMTFLTISIGTPERDYLICIINEQELWPFSIGELNRSLVEKSTKILKAKSCDIQTNTIQDDYRDRKDGLYRVRNMLSVFLKG